jgi:hypothetical protein
MNPLIRLLVILAIGGGGAYFGITSYNKLKVKDAHELDLARIQKEWLERANWVNATPEAEKYKEERSSIDKWYFTALNDHYNRYPTFKNYYRVGDELGGKGGEKGGKKGGKKGGGDDALKGQYYELTKSVFDSLKEGSYSPVLTSNSNSLRLDIYKLGRDKGGKLRFDLVLWGAQRKLEKEAQAAGNTISRMLTACTFTAMNFKFIDEKGKVMGEMNVTGDPEIKVDYPERWIEEFPPQAVIGFYELDPLPAEPVKMQLEMTVTSRSGTGSDIPGSFKFEVPIDPSWKLGQGEKWEGATTEERSKDYIEGKAQQ